MNSWNINTKIYEYGNSIVITISQFEMHTIFASDQFLFLLRKHFKTIKLLTTEIAMHKLVEKKKKKNT